MVAPVPELAPASGMSVDVELVFELLWGRPVCDGNAVKSCVVVDVPLAVAIVVVVDEAPAPAIAAFEPDVMTVKSLLMVDSDRVDAVELALCVAVGALVLAELSKRVLSDVLVAAFFDSTLAVPLDTPLLTGLVELPDKTAFSATPVEIGDKLELSEIAAFGPGPVTLPGL